jgi:hypothetical protein
MFLDTKISAKVVKVFDMQKEMKKSFFFRAN